VGDGQQSIPPDEGDRIIKEIETIKEKIKEASICYG
jgi:hypothetical protein